MANFHCFIQMQSERQLRVLSIGLEMSFLYIVIPPFLIQNDSFIF